MKNGTIHSIHTVPIFTLCNFYYAIIIKFIEMRIIYKTRSGYKTYNPLGTCCNVCSPPFLHTHLHIHYNVHETASGIHCCNIISFYFKLECTSYIVNKNWKFAYLYILWHHLTKLRINPYIDIYIYKLTINLLIDPSRYLCFPLVNIE